MARRTDLDYVSAAAGAVASFWGWTLLYLATWSVGVGVGAAIGAKSLSALSIAIVGPIALVFLPFGAFADIWLMVGTLLVPACWALPLYYDWQRPRPVFLLLMLPFACRMGYWCGGVVSAI